MKLKVQPVRRMKKRRTHVWVDCDESCAQAYEIRDSKGKTLRRESSRQRCDEVVRIYAKPKKPIDKAALLGKRWADVKDKL